MVEFSNTVRIGVVWVKALVFMMAVRFFFWVCRELKKMVRYRILFLVVVTRSSAVAVVEMARQTCDTGRTF